MGLFDFVGDIGRKLFNKEEMLQKRLQSIWRKTIRALKM